MLIPARGLKATQTSKATVKHAPDGKPTLTQQGIDVDKFIRENHALIERLRKGTR